MFSSTFAFAIRLVNPRERCFALFRPLTARQRRGMLSLRRFGQCPTANSIKLIKDHMEVKAIYANPSQIVSANVDPVAEAIFSVNNLMPETSEGLNQLPAQQRSSLLDLFSYTSRTGFLQALKTSF